MKKTLQMLSVALVSTGLLAGAAFAHDVDNPRRQKMLEKFDTDKDGSLDENERSAMRQARESRFQEKLAKYDANKDGKLDDAERAVAREEHAKARFEKLDTNNDGMLSIDEFKAGAKDRKHRRHFGR